MIDFLHRLFGGARCPSTSSRQAPPDSAIGRIPAEIWARVADAAEGPQPTTSWETAGRLQQALPWLNEPIQVFTPSCRAHKLVSQPAARDWLFRSRLRALSDADRQHFAGSKALFLHDLPKTWIYTSYDEATERDLFTSHLYAPLQSAMLTEVLKHSPVLTTLDLSHNHLEKLLLPVKEWAEHVPHWEKDLPGNPGWLWTSDRTTAYRNRSYHRLFGGLQQLRHLALVDTLLTAEQVNHFAFELLPSLQSLDISRNRIDPQIPLVFRGQNIRNLVLRDNQHWQRWQPQHVKNALQQSIHHLQAIDLGETADPTTSAAIVDQLDDIITDTPTHPEGWHFRHGRPCVFFVSPSSDDVARDRIDV